MKISLPVFSFLCIANLQAKSAQFSGAYTNFGIPLDLEIVSNSLPEIASNNLVLSTLYKLLFSDKFSFKAKEKSTNYSNLSFGYRTRVLSTTKLNQIQQLNFLSKTLDYKNNMTFGSNNKIAKNYHVNSAGIIK